MQLRHRIDRSFPPLGWALKVELSTGVISATLGDSLEYDEDYCVEGAWDGSFQHLDFIDSEHFTGSGFKLQRNELHISTSSYPLEALYTFMDGKYFYCANHIALLMTLSGVRLLERFPFYDRISQTVNLGTNRVFGLLPSDKGSIRLHFQSTLIVHGCPAKVRVSKNATTARRLSNFDKYREALSNVVANVISNAADLRRRYPRAPISSISSGYDGAALSAIGATAEALADCITITTPRKEFSNSDSGERVAELLGLRCIAVQPGPQIESAFDKRLEKWVIATAFGGGDLVWIGPHKHLIGKMLLSGHNGDTLWTTKADNVSRFSARTAPSGSSILGLRLNANFFHFCPLFAHSSQLPEIVELSNSPEMAKWRLRNNYDRPIPRRILEECGVDRQSFGMEKKAAETPIFYADERGSERDSVSANYRVQFENECLSGGQEVPPLYRTLSLISRSAVVKLIARVAKKLPGKSRLAYSLIWSLMKTPEPFNSITPWSANCIADELSKAMSAHSDGQ